MVFSGSDIEDRDILNNDSSRKETESESTKNYLTNHAFGSEEIPNNVHEEFVTLSEAVQNSPSSKKYIVSLDIGTTIVRSFAFDRDVEISASSEQKVELLQPKPGYAEMDPEEIWLKCCHVIREVVSCVGVENVSCLGICTQRCTFLLWDAVTGKPLHNLITWKDLRADALVNKWNKSFLMKCLRWGSSVLSFLTGNDRFLACSVLTFMNIQVVMRLKWALENVPDVQQLIAQKRVRFGTLDTWIVHKLTNGKVFATDYSNASGTAMFDPYLNEWSSFVMGILSIPMGIMPELRPSAGDWGDCHDDLFGAQIPIAAVVSDQGASLAGGGGHSRGHLKITLGTGGFMNLNTGARPLTSVHGIYPVVAWQGSDGNVVYMAEASALDVGTVIEWGQRVGLFADVSETAAIAASVKDSGGVFFVPALQGLQAPVNDSTATCGFMGITSGTSRAHLVRALLDSISFLVYQMFEAMKEEANYKLLDARVDGGVARNELIVQQVATLTQRSLSRCSTTQLSALGAALVAGVAAGVYKNLSAVDDLLQVERVFEPVPSERPGLLRQFRRWQKTCRRFKGWTSSEEGAVTVVTVLAAVTVVTVLTAVTVVTVLAAVTVVTVLAAVTVVTVLAAVTVVTVLAAVTVVTVLAAVTVVTRLAAVTVVTRPAAFLVRNSSSQIFATS
ncbi:Carbohydrate kinase FGGY N-terminal [Trinorchestia longiramus]|nr:Carbohydrate kinase FGGY N-terminal [Trinorchestia longiramus]